jgi:hypothetical protein
MSNLEERERDPSDPGAFKPERERREREQAPKELARLLSQHVRG